MHPVGPPKGLLHHCLYLGNREDALPIDDPATAHRRSKGHVAPLRS